MPWRTRKSLNPMTTERQKYTNRANAQKSTGPMSTAGKTASSQNATTHGLSMPPPPEDVLRWVRIIVGDITVTSETLGTGPTAMATLALAEARAQLERVQTAEDKHIADLRKYAQTRLDPNPMTADLDDLDDPSILQWLLGGRHDRETKQMVRLLLKSNRKDPMRIADQLRRLERYARRAQNRERKAFRTWARFKRGSDLQNEAKYNYNANASFEHGSS